MKTAISATSAQARGCRGLIINAGIRLETDAAGTVTSAALLRTARKLMDVVVFG